MRLQSLKLTIDKHVVRTIQFKDGLNLITNKKGVGRTGNSIGKSTLSRVVDYLFLGGIDSIYIDDEFKRPNEKIEHLFRTSDVEAELIIRAYDGVDRSISRNLCIEPARREFKVDGKAVDQDKYESSLHEILFRVVTSRPSVRSLVPKFVRNDSHRMLNTAKFLDLRSSGKDYAEVFLYLFGFDDTKLLTEKREATNAVSKRKKHNASINALVKEQKPRSDISKYASRIVGIEKELLSFKFSNRFQDPLGLLGELQVKEEQFTQEILGINRKINNINKTIELLSNNGGNYLAAQLREIYSYAKVSVDSVVDDFESVLAFHDGLVAKKKQFISVDLPELEDRRVGIEGRIEGINRERQDVFSDMKSAESVSNITSKIKDLGDLKVELGKLEGLLDQQKKTSDSLRKAQDDLDEILQRVSKALSNVYIFEGKFNGHFSAITRKTHAEDYLFELNFDEASGVCDPKVINTASNPEGGRKKAEVIAFDFSYIQAVIDTGINRPLFVFHDGIEDIDQKQIDEIFSISNAMGGQQIVSILSDKLTDGMYQKYLPDMVLMLADDDMFFRVT